MPPWLRPSPRPSALPAATHSPFTNFQRQPSAGTKSSRKEYMELGSRPETLTFSTGNIRLMEEEEKKKKEEDINIRIVRQKETKEREVEERAALHLMMLRTVRQIKQ
ncbi:hypothetical protein INR49_021977 [Caranx melampygus]|nr:hypothetical protein INR49_021977 [Caranx melampygus]